MPQLNLTPLLLTDDDLDRLSPITEQDIVITNSFFEKTVDREFQNLLLTESQELVELEESE
jgi:hypothetical protein